MSCVYLLFRFVSFDGDRVRLQLCMNVCVRANETDDEFSFFIPDLFQLKLLVFLVASLVPYYFSGMLKSYLGISALSLRIISAKESLDNPIGEWRLGCCRQHFNAKVLTESKELVTGVLTCQNALVASDQSKPGKSRWLRSWTVGS
jgi:hypothetical protein